jgi:hypothetical protein
MNENTEPQPRDRYAQCTADCTTDCGACKGVGRPITAQPRQLPGMARLMELTPELYAHYAD